MKEFTLPLDIPDVTITQQAIDNSGNIILSIKSTKTKTKCKQCGKDATKRYGYGPEISIRHLPILDTPVYLKIKPARYQCKHCGNNKITTEEYEWCAKGAKQTKGLEDYIMRSLINSTVSDVAKKEKIGYKALVSMIDRQINTGVDWSNYDDLDTLGIDEISTKKGHQYFVTIVSVVTTQGDLSVIAVLPDRLKDTVKHFLESIPDDLKSTVNTVCTDMYDGYVNAAAEVFGQQAVVIDRYHVAKLYREPLDKLRIKEMKRLKDELSPEVYAELAGVMWLLRKQYECLTEADKSKLKLLYKYSPLLKKAHRLALKLTQIFNTHSTKKSALAKINRWIAKVEKSGLSCFNKFINTLEKYKNNIANYFKERRSSGFVEGLNNKIKVVKRRCYGFFKTETLFQRLFLDLQGYKLYA